MRSIRFFSAVDVCLVLAALAPTARADMPHNDMPHNSISLAGLTKAKPLLDAIANGRLDDATIDGALAGDPSLKDSDVGALLDKIVSCALDRRTTLKPFPAPPPSGLSSSIELAGELGLCGNRSGFGNWHTDVLTGSARTSCQEAVSACVLARVNAKGHRIVISVRTRAPMPIKLEKEVPIETEYRDHKPVGIFAACTPGANECGYRPQFVGRCTAGAVTVTARAADTSIYVCEGLYGCDDPLPPGVDYTRRISKGVGSAIFTCPTPIQAFDGTRWGYYSVMTKPASPTGNPAIKPIRGRYPAPEKDVFTWPEGAFYGNLFRTDLTAAAARPYIAKQQSPVLAGAQYACYSPVWSQGVAELNDRFCALPHDPVAADCFANPPMGCFQAPGDRCATNAVSSLAFGDCKPTAGINPPYSRVITTYLNHPCDLASDKCTLEERVRPGGRGGSKATVSASVTE